MGHQDAATIPVQERKEHNCLTLGSVDMVDGLSGGRSGQSEQGNRNIPQASWCLFTANIQLTGAGITHVDTVTAFI